MNTIADVIAPYLAIGMGKGAADVAAHIREVREHLGVSQEGFARQLGVSFATVNRWENGKTAPSRLARGQFDDLCRRLVKSGMLPDQYLPALRKDDSAND